MPKAESDILKKIKNKQLRSQIYREMKHEAMGDRLKMRKEREKEESAHPELREKRLAKNTPDTIESKRVFDETVNVELEGEDEFASYFTEVERDPKILITTSRFPHKDTYKFAATMVEILPNATFIRRKPEYSMKEIAEFCSNREYTHLVVINENKKMPTGLSIFYLPKGPSFYFSITSLVPREKVTGHGRQTKHMPELVLNNFTTRLGKTVARLFQTLFPHKPEFQGRQVVTLHNQRDFIFFRMHRYIFKENKRVGLQALGPEFTLRLRRINRGINEEVDWEHRPDMDRDKRRFYL